LCPSGTRSRACRRACRGSRASRRSHPNRNRHGCTGRSRSSSSPPWRGLRPTPRSSRETRPTSVRRLPGEPRRASTGLTIPDSGVWLLSVVLADELRELGPTLYPGFLKNRRDVGVGGEVLPALLIPVENHPDPVVLIGIAKDGCTLGPVLLPLRSALG